MLQACDAVFLWECRARACISDVPKAVCDPSAVQAGRLFFGSGVSADGRMPHVAWPMNYCGEFGVQALPPILSTSQSPKGMRVGMAALRGPDSSEDKRRLGEQAVFPETVDVNIRQLDPIPAPRAFLRELPLTEEMGELVRTSRQEIRDVLRGRDDRLLVIVGPCSIHDPKAAHEYAEKLAAVQRELNDRLLIVMRVYFEKPRTTIGWKGLINDPDLDGQFNIRKGMWEARKVLTDVLSLGLPIVRAIPKARCTASWPVACRCRSGSRIPRTVPSRPRLIPVMLPRSSIISCPSIWMGV